MCWRGCVPTDPALLAAEGTRERAQSFAAVLADMGLECAVEDRDALAVIHAASNVVSRLADPAVRRRVVGLGRGLGFTHVAVTVGHT